MAHAFLGVTTAPITAQDAKTLNLPTSKGALVQEVTSGSPAAKSGIKAGNQQTATLVIGGDLIVKVGTKAITKPDDISSAIGTMKPGQRVVVQFYRGGKLKSATVTLGNRPASVDSSQSQQTFPFP